MNSENRVSRQRNPKGVESWVENKRENENGDVEAAMKEAYRNVAANLAASAWGEDVDPYFNRSGSFRNKGKLGPLSLQVVTSPLNYGDKSTSAFVPIEVKKEANSNFEKLKLHENTSLPNSEEVSKVFEKKV